MDAPDATRAQGAAEQQDASEDLRAVGAEIIPRDALEERALKRARVEGVNEEIDEAPEEKYPPFTARAKFGDGTPDDQRRRCARLRHD
eukprot:CAMPEP_0119295486 /NCGR_PEP_ID=MMETSP1329-20130426/49843_1 /TAXON_ID=114041 /ORGANISM="Genus nov. species nov., Strain RCC1024" /LENGTH=87 /DNA_ID=CAMNT_0007296399 /DNA_START=75 /DNA_END=335 /DNA_ORIENTATION=+